MHEGQDLGGHSKGQPSGKADKGPDDRADFIDEPKIWHALEVGRKASAGRVREILARAKEKKGLSIEELASLLWVEDPEILHEIFRTAREIKEEIYGKRLVLFAPLYVSDYCVNDCKYCAYKRANQYRRKRLTMDEVRRETACIQDMGHKRIALEAGEDPAHCPIDYITDVMKAIYDTKSKNGQIRRINVNIAATTVDNYKRLKEAGIGTYVLFQETYHRETYRNVHNGPKADYDWHTTAMGRAFKGGIDDVGIGVLFGLFDWRFETVALLMHAKYLDSHFGVGPHTISFPRLRPALGMSLSDFSHLVKDDDFRKIVACLRLSVPYTGMILSTREEPHFREEVIALGISQISAGSKTGVGEYYSDLMRENHEGKPRKGLEEGVRPQLRCFPSDDAQSDPPQFQVSDERDLDEVIQSLLTSGYIPSFCTACYRSGRTGERFMGLAKTFHIHEFCQPNAILTFQEYLCDYASPETREKAEVVLDRALGQIKEEALRQECQRRMATIRMGERDLYF